MADLKSLIGRVADGHALTRPEAETAFDIMMSGDATPSQIGGFLMGLRVRGETIDEIAGAVSTMRSKMTRVTAPANAIDIVGTGGDGSGSYNISTCTALVVAGCGVPVAKHGNRSLSSRSGAAEVLASLGVDIEIGPDVIAACIEKAGIGFMFAPAHHSAMRHVGPTRVELGTRTIFNILGPLSNPAGVSRQLVGVFAEHWLDPLAEALRALGSEAIWVVHGSDGLDEITTTGPTHVAELRDGTIKRFTIHPDDAGLPVADPQDLRGGDPATNAAALRKVLAGEPSAYRDIVLMNAAASLIVAGKVQTLRDGVAMAAHSIDSGTASARLTELVSVSNSG
ncbi:MAG: anthranilate phosphoribosyltransferase [Pseudomonadota bacterium]